MTRRNVASVTRPLRATHACKAGNTFPDAAVNALCTSVLIHAIARQTDRQKQISQSRFELETFSVLD